MQQRSALLAACLVLLTGCTGSGIAREAEAARDAGAVDGFLRARTAEITFIDGKKVWGRSVSIGETEITWTPMSGGRTQARPLHHVEQVAIDTKGRSTLSGLGLGFVSGVAVGAGVLWAMFGEREDAVGGQGSAIAAGIVGAGSILGGTLAGGAVGLARESQSHRVVLYQRPAP